VGSPYVPVKTAVTMRKLATDNGPIAVIVDFLQRLRWERRHSQSRVRWRERGSGGAAVQLFLAASTGRHIGRQRHPVDQNERVDIGFVGVGLAHHEAIQRDEVVVAANEQEIVVGRRGVEYRHDRKALPLFIEVVGVVGVAVAKVEAVQLGVVVDVEEFLVERRGDRGIEHALGRRTWSRRGWSHGRRR